MSASSSDTHVPVAADKLRGRHSAVADRKSKCLDHAEPDRHPPRHSRPADGDEDGRGEVAVRAGAGRRRRQRAAAAHRKSRQQQQQQPEVMTSSSSSLRRVDVGDDDDDDDAGSVCSGASSASENSTASRGSAGGRRTGRRARGGASRSIRTFRHDGGSRDTTRQTTEQSFKCQPDCRTRSTSASPPPADGSSVSGSCFGVERPEPEGGVRTVPCKSSTSDEFERLIYGQCEPLFSDGGGEDCLDDDVDVTKDRAVTTSKSVRASQQQQQQPRRRFTGAVGSSNVDESTESLFSAAQMMSTNNMMKFAIIQMELKNVKDISLRRVRFSCCN